jgi:transporter family-2 protein
MAGLLPLILVLIAGIGLAVQPPTNAALATASGSVILSALTSFLIGAVVLLVAWAAIDRTSPMALKGAPGWAWLGGFYGAGFVAVLAYAAPKLGISVALTAAIASQLVAALIVDHFGLFDVKVEPVSIGKLVGVGLVIAGAVVVRRG